jgi:histidine triad (HIT) family protein
MPTDPNCLFCKIIAGQIPSFKVFEDDAVFAFLDIGPLTNGHTLVIPKAHHPTVMAIPPEALAAAAARLPSIAKAVLAATGAPACHILINNGEQAMQTVHHLHIHIIPRSDNDTFTIPWKTTPLDKTSAPQLVQHIQSHLQSPIQST